MAGGDLHVAQVDPGSRGQVAEAAGAGVPVHPGTAPVAQQRPVLAAIDGPVDGPPDRGRQRDEDDLGALADHAQDAVAVKKHVGHVLDKLGATNRTEAAAGPDNSA
jgi:hypothetical protein